VTRGRGVRLSSGSANRRPEGLSAKQEVVAFALVWQEGAAEADMSDKADVGGL